MSEGEKQVTVEELDGWVAELRAQRLVCETKTAELAVENTKKARLEGQIAAALKALNRDNYKTDEGTFSFRRAWRFNLPQGEEKKRFIAWLEQQGIAEQYLTVNSQSFNSLLNQEREAAIREGRFLDIPGVPEPQLFETVSFRKGKM